MEKHAALLVPSTTHHLRKLLSTGVQEFEFNERTVQSWVLLLYTGLASSLLGYVVMILNSTDGWRKKRENTCWCLSLFSMLALIIPLQVLFQGLIIPTTPDNGRTAAAVLFFASYFLLTSCSWSLTGALMSLSGSGPMEDRKSSRRMVLASLLVLIVPMPTSILVALCPIVESWKFAMTAVLFYLGQTMFTALLAVLVYTFDVILQRRDPIRRAEVSFTLMYLIYSIFLLLIFCILTAILALETHEFTNHDLPVLSTLTYHYLVGLIYCFIWMISFVVFIFTLFQMLINRLL